MKKILILTIIFIGLAIVSYVIAAPSVIYQRNVLPETDSTFDLGSSTPMMKWKNIWADTLLASSTSMTDLNFDDASGTHLYIDQDLTVMNGRVGIGTENPAYKLEVVSTNNDIIAITDSDGSYNRRAQLGHINGSGGNIAVWDDSNNLTGIIRSYASAGVQAYFTAGNVGIGTDAPRYKLTSSGSGVDILGIISTTVSSAGSGAGIQAGLSTAPTAQGHRLGFYTLGVLDSPTLYRNGIAISGFADQAWTLGSAQGSYLTFATTPIDSTTRTEVMRLASTGNVGIGTTSPAFALDVYGTARVETELMIPIDQTGVNAGDIRYNSTDVALEYYDGAGWHDSGSPKWKAIKALAQSEGNLNLTSSTDWNIDKAIIKSIMILTTATSWDAILYMDDNFDIYSMMPPLTIAEDYNASTTLYLDFPYYDEDVTKEVHLYLDDNADPADTFDIYINGYQMR